MSQHTKEPWVIISPKPNGSYSIKNAIGVIVAYGLDIDSARRIVACVNACAGIETELLEVLPKLSLSVALEYPKLITSIADQRDELLAAAQKLCEKLPKPGAQALFGFVDKEIDNLLQVIAKAVQP